MNKIKLWALLAAVPLAFSCQVFLGPQPDSSPQGIFNRIWNDFNETYTLFEARGVDWDEVYQTYSPQISPGMNDYDLFRVCSQMLITLNDPHVGLITPFGYSDFLRFSDLDYDDFIWRDRVPFSLSVVQMYMEGRLNHAGSGRFSYGRFKEKPNVGYLHIRDFFEFKMDIDMIPDWVKEIDAVVSSLLDTDVLIIDVRNSWGGVGSNMDYISSRFASEREDYITFCAKNGTGRGDFSDPITWSIKPAGTRYAKPIVLITNQETVSASEWFVMALRTQSHVTHVGETSCGAFSARIIRPLINGWEYSISVLKVMDMDGICYEGVGISPNEEHRVANDWDDLHRGTDAQIDYALSLFW